MTNIQNHRSNELLLNGGKGGLNKSDDYLIQDAEANTPLPSILRNEDLICTKSAAKWLGISHQTLEKWRSQNRGPRFCKIGGKTIRYRKLDLQEFIEELL